MVSRAAFRTLWLFALVACGSPDEEQNRPPIANAGPDLRLILEGGIVYGQLDGTASHDPEDDPFEFRWSVVRAPQALFFDDETHDAPAPTLGLRTPGLYIFKLIVRDSKEADSSPDFANIWVALARDDMGGFEKDAGAPGADTGVLADGAVDDGGGDTGGPDTGTVVNRPPVVAGGPTSSRVRVGESFRLSAAATTDDGVGTLTYSWRLLGAPLGAMNASFEAVGPEIEYPARWPGRYAFELTVSDGEFTDSVASLGHAIGPVAYVLVPPRAEILQLDLTSGEVGDRFIAPLPSGHVPTGFLARHGSLYVTTASDAGLAILQIIAPGQSVLRRPLPVGLAAPPTGGPDGVWVPGQSVPQLFYTDPFGVEPMETLDLPADRPRPRAIAFMDNAAFVAHSPSPDVLMRVRLPDRRYEGEVFDIGETCGAESLFSRDGFLYIGCRNSNAVLRADLAEPNAPPNLQPFAGQEWGNQEIVVGLGWAFARHERTGQVGAIPLTHFDLPPDAPERAGDVQATVDLGEAVLDIAQNGPVVYALLATADNTNLVVGWSAATREIVFRAEIGVRGATHIALDVADDQPIDGL